MSIRSLLEHVGVEVGDVIFIDGVPLDEGRVFGGARPGPVILDEFAEFDCS